MKTYLAQGSTYWMEVQLPFPSILFRRVYNRHKVETTSKKLKRILIHFEEPLRKSKPSAEVIEDAHLFDFIFTTDKKIVNNVPHAYWSPLAECWTNGSLKCHDRIDRTSEVKEKEFSVSFNNTRKMNHGGFYTIRKEIWDTENQIKIPTRFYDSNETPINDGHPKLPQSDKFQVSDKIILYKSMYNICPENNDDENFSQRLIDCLINRTVPIYRGYPNIHEHFNIDGIILIESCENIINKINSLTPEDYNDRLNAY